MKNIFAVFLLSTLILMLNLSCEVKTNYFDDVYGRVVVYNKYTQPITRIVIETSFDRDNKDAVVLIDENVSIAPGSNSAEYKINLRHDAKHNANNWGWWNRYNIIVTSGSWKPSRIVECYANIVNILDLRNDGFWERE